jgi:protein phosphatase
MIIDLQASCDLGCVRANNEDLILIGGELVRDRRHESQAEVGATGTRCVVAVADGMGGAAAGEWASEMALDRLKGFLDHAPADLDADELAQLLDIWAAETHRELLAEGARDPKRQGAGTTVVGLVVHPAGALRFHAGDSRLYRYRGGQMTRLTQDHSLRQATGDAAVATHLLLNSLGGGERSWLEILPIEGGLQDFDRFLLCSDGLHDLIGDEDIAAALAAGRSSAVNTLVHMARDAGGKDNISVAIVDLGRAAWPEVQAG